MICRFSVWSLIDAIVIATFADAAAARSYADHEGRCDVWDSRTGTIVYRAK